MEQQSSMEVDINTENEVRPENVDPEDERKEERHYRERQRGVYQSDMESMSMLM